MGDMSAEGLMPQGRQDAPAPVNGTPGVEALSKKPTPDSISFKNRIARTVLGLSALFGAAAVAGDKLGAYDDHNHPVKDIGELKTDLKNTIFGESTPIVILRDNTQYDFSVQPFQLPGHPTQEEPKFYKSPDAKDDQLVSKEDFARLGIRPDVQGNVLLGRGYLVKGAPYKGGTANDASHGAEGVEETKYGKWVQVQFPGGTESVYVQEQFARRGNPVQK